ncbi:hypothetical protein ScPMuIL_010756 [Solemya velum]
MAFATEANITKDAPLAQRAQQEDYRPGSKSNSKNHTMKWDWIPKSKYVTDSFEESLDFEENIRTIVSARHSSAEKTGKKQANETNAHSKLPGSKENERQVSKLQLSENKPEHIENIGSRKTGQDVRQQDNITVSDDSGKVRGLADKARWHEKGSCREQIKHRSDHDAITCGEQVKHRSDHDAITCGKQVKHKSDHDSITCGEQVKHKSGHDSIKLKDEASKKSSSENDFSVMESQDIKTNRKLCGVRSDSGGLGSEGEMLTKSFSLVNNNTSVINPQSHLHKVQPSSSTRIHVEPKDRYVNGSETRSSLQHPEVASGIPIQGGSHTFDLKFSFPPGTQVEFDIELPFNATGNSVPPGATDDYNESTTSYQPRIDGLSNSRKTETKTSFISSNDEKKREMRYREIGFQNDVRYQKKNSGMYSSSHRSIQTNAPSVDKGIVGDAENRAAAMGSNGEAPPQLSPSTIQYLHKHGRDQTKPQKLDQYSQSKHEPPTRSYGPQSYDKLRKREMYSEEGKPAPQSKPSVDVQKSDERETKGAEDDLQLARKLQAEEDAAFYAQKLRGKEKKKKYGGAVWDPCSHASEETVQPSEEKMRVLDKFLAATIDHPWPQANVLSAPRPVRRMYVLDTYTTGRLGRNKQEKTSYEEKFPDYSHDNEYIEDFGNYSEQSQKPWNGTRRELAPLVYPHPRKNISEDRHNAGQPQRSLRTSNSGTGGTGMLDRMNRANEKFDKAESWIPDSTTNQDLLDWQHGVAETGDSFPQYRFSYRGNEDISKQSQSSKEYSIQTADVSAKNASLRTKSSKGDNGVKKYSAQEYQRQNDEFVSSKSKTYDEKNNTNRQNMDFIPRIYQQYPSAHTGYPKRYENSDTRQTDPHKNFVSREYQMNADNCHDNSQKRNLFTSQNVELIPKFETERGNVQDARNPNKKHTKDSNLSIHAPKHLKGKRAIDGETSISSKNQEMTKPKFNVLEADSSSGPEKPPRNFGVNKFGSNQTVNEFAQSEKLLRKKKRNFPSAPIQKAANRGRQNRGRHADLTEQNILADDLNLDDYETCWEVAEMLGDVKTLGLREEELSNLPVHEFHDGASNVTETECRVCLNSFRSSERVRTLPCLHFFHQRCIDKWLKMNAICPVCRENAKGFFA